MGRREFSVRQIAEVLTHWDARRGIRQIARSLGMDRNTVRKYIHMAEQAGFEPGQERPLSAWTVLVQKSFPGLADPVERSDKFGLLEPHRAEIREGIKTNKVTTVWQRLTRGTGVPVSLTTFRRYVHLTCTDLIEPREVTVWRPEVEPGEEAEIDFGKLGLLHDPVAGRKRLVRAVQPAAGPGDHPLGRPLRRPAAGRRLHPCPDLR